MSRDNDIRRLQEELDRCRAELETAYEELESTVEELEATNAELQSTNEELETTNEELEKMTAELQSTYDALGTINAELRQRTDDLNDANAFLEALLVSVSSGVVVTDPDLRVRVWNAQAAELWGLRADEVDGEDLMVLDIGLPVDQLHAPVRACLAGGDDAVVTLLAVNRRGRSIQCRVACAPLRNAEAAVIGAILVMDASDSLAVADGGTRADGA